MKIGLDLSVNSSAMVIDEHLFNYTTESSNNKWIKLTSDYINFRFFENVKQKEYSDNEIYKLRKYDEITDLIFNDIVAFTKGEKIDVLIEGISYGSPGKIPDLVTHATLLKRKLLALPNLESIKIIPPTSLKKAACIAVYGYKSRIGKKGQPLKGKESRNNDGLSGGDFKKHDMFKAFIDSTSTNKFKKHCYEMKNNILKMKSIPKPYDDIIDSYFLVFSDLV